MLETLAMPQERENEKDGDEQPEEEFSESQLHDVIAGTEIISQSEIQRLKQEYEEIMKPKEKNERKEYKAVIMPLHGQLPLAEQEKIYAPLKESERLILVSTNVAESSLTVPDVKFIIDACRQKQKVHTSVGSRLATKLCSAASLTQRAGRAGRVCPGHCFRLLTPAEMTKVKPHDICEMLRLPLEGVLLKLLVLGVEDVKHFPFPEPPEAKKISDALENLYSSNCILMSKETGLPVLTKFGEEVADVPLDFRQSVLFCTSKTFYGAMMAAAYSVENLFVFGQADMSYPVKSGKGDFIDRMFTFGAYLFNQQPSQKAQFCSKHNLRLQAFQEMDKIFS